MRKILILILGFLAMVFMLYQPEETGVNQSPVFQKSENDPGDRELQKLLNELEALRKEADTSYDGFGFDSPVFYPPLEEEETQESEESVDSTNIRFQDYQPRSASGIR